MRESLRLRQFRHRHRHRRGRRHRKPPESAGAWTATYYEGDSLDSLDDLPAEAAGPPLRQLAAEKDA